LNLPPGGVQPQFGEALDAVSAKPTLLAASSSVGTGGVEPCFLQSELLRQRMVLPRPRFAKYHLLVSVNNVGAESMLAELRVAHGVEVLITREPLVPGQRARPSAERMFVYLTAQTWAGERGDALAKEVSEALRQGLPLLLAHEEPYVALASPSMRTLHEDAVERARDAIALEISMKATPMEIRKQLYTYTALPLSGGFLRSTSRVMVAKAIAEQPVSALRRRVQVAWSTALGVGETGDRMLGRSVTV